MTFIAPAPENQGPTLLGYTPMDDIHEEFETLLAQALTCTDAQLEHCLDLLHQHLKFHFDEEDRWMRSTDFPASECHINEHAAVLKSSEEVRRHVAAGNLSIGRTFATELDKWFPAHAAYLDSALAAWMCKRRLGGVPVVLHRNNGP